jgi:hypothetical protein
MEPEGVHKSSPLVPILSQTNSVHTTPSYLRSTLILSTHQPFSYPSVFSSVFPTNILYAFLYVPIRATCPDHLIIFEVIILIII